MTTTKQRNPEDYKCEFHKLELWTQIALHRAIVKRKYDISYLINADYIQWDNNCTYRVCTSQKNCTGININFSKKHKDWAIEQARLWQEKEVSLV